MKAIDKPNPLLYPEGANIDAYYGPWETVSAFVAFVQECGLEKPYHGTKFAVGNAAKLSLPAKSVKVYVWDETVSADANGHTYKEIGGGASSVQLDGKQDKLSEAQMAAVNSGITETKVGTYDGYERIIRNFGNHVSSTSNPHGVTKSHVGLGNVDNTSDANKPISTAMQTALNSKQGKLSDEQMNAVKSGITESRVAQYDSMASKVSEAYESATSAEASAQRMERKFDTLYEKIDELPDGEAVSAQVLLNTSDIEALKDDTKGVISATSSADTENDLLTLSDNSGNVLAEISKKGIKTKNFDSATVSSSVDRLTNSALTTLETDEQRSGVSLVDEEGNVLAEISEYGIKTKNFDSRNIGSSNLSLGKLESSTIVNGSAYHLDVPDIKFDNTITLSAKVSVFGKLRIFRGDTSLSGNNRCTAIEIDNTNIYSYDSSGQLANTVAHGITIESVLFVSVSVKNTSSKKTFKDYTSADVTLASTSGIVTKEVNWYNGCCGGIDVTFSGSSASKLILRYHPRSLSYDTWVFGDSYLDYWVKYANDLGSKMCIDGYSGRASASAKQSFDKCLSYGYKPKRIVWGLGMNDIESSGMNAAWKSAFDYAYSWCANNGVEFIGVTVPTTPTRSNIYKNAYIKTKCQRIVDVDSAVGADASPSWYNGLIETGEAKIHPSEIGSSVVCMAYTSAVPEIINK